VLGENGRVKRWEIIMPLPETAQISALPFQLSLDMRCLQIARGLADTCR
jgi:hypothetical protein